MQAGEAGGMLTVVQDPSTIRLEAEGTVAFTTPSQYVEIIEAFRARKAPALEQMHLFGARGGPATFDDPPIEMDRKITEKNVVAFIEERFGRWWTNREVVQTLTGKDANAADAWVKTNNRRMTVNEAIQKAVRALQAPPNNCQYTRQEFPSKPALHCVVRDGQDFPPLARPEATLDADE